MSTGRNSCTLVSAFVAILVHQTLGHECIVIVGGVAPSSRDSISSENSTNETIYALYHPTRGRCSENVAIRLNESNHRLNGAPLRGCYMESLKKLLLWSQKWDELAYLINLSNGEEHPINATDIYQLLITMGSSSVDQSGKKCYAFGGNQKIRKQGTDRISNSRKSFVFDIDDGFIRQLADLPNEKSEMTSGPGGPHGMLVIAENGKVLLYTDSNDSWRMVAPVSTSHDWHTRGSASVALGTDKVMSCGGSSMYHWFSDTRPYSSNKCMIYSMSNNQWEEGPSMLASRGDFQMINFNEVIYAIGGVDPANSNDTQPLVEYYDEIEKKWKNDSIALPPFNRFGSLIFAV